MKIVDLLKVESIDLKAKPQDKAAALEHLITLMERGGNIADKEEYKACVLRREEEGSTGIGEGIAIPHAKLSSIKKSVVVIGVSRLGIDFGSDEPCKVFFLVLAPEDNPTEHIQLLSSIAKVCSSSLYARMLKSAKNSDDVYQLFFD